MSTPLQQAKQLLDPAQHIAIFWHRNVDGDAVGSCIALWTLLQDQGKTISYFTPKPVAAQFAWFPESQQFQSEFDYGDYDLLVFLDTANPEQLLTDFWIWQDSYFSSHSKLVIDHHISNTHYGDLNLVDSNVSSACEYLTELIEARYPGQITPLIATYLLMGISTDTGHFIYEDDSQRTFEIAARLLSYGADKKKIVKEMRRKNSLSELQMTSLLISRITQQGKILSSRYTDDDLTQFDLEKEAADGFLHYFTTLDHDGVFMLFKGHAQELPPYINCSFRTQHDTIDVSALASHYKGGGHRAAAGARIPITTNFEDTMASMIGKINDLLS